MRALARQSIGGLGLCCALALCGCQGRALPTPRIAGISPAQGGDDAPLAVAISGDHFLPRSFTDFSHGDNSAVDEGFAAWLVPADPGQAEIALSDVRRISEQALTALVPAGPARGFYGLRLVDPFGREASLPSVYRVVHSAKALSGFAFEPIASQRAAVPFTLLVSAVDAEGVVVDGFSGPVGLLDSTGTLSPTTLSFTLGRARAQVAVATLTDADVLEADDGHGHTGRSSQFAVQAGLAVQLGLGGLPSKLEAGACSGRVEVQTQDTSGTPAPTTVALTVTVEASPPDRFALFSDDACTEPLDAPTIAAGSASGPFAFRARRAGTLALKASAPGIPPAIRSIAIAPLSASKLDFSTPSQGLKAGSCSARISLGLFDAFDNPVPAVDAVSLTLLSVPAGALSFYSDDACQSAVSTASLSPDASTFDFFVRGDTAGTSSVRAEAGSTLAPGLLPLTVSP